VTPDVTLARAAGLELGDAGGAVADRHLRSSAPDVYLAGDICEYDSVVHRRRLRVEHWDVAYNHGRVAALNMLGREQVFDVVPYFWSDLADWASLEYVGPALDGWDEEIVRGSLDEGEFTVWQLKGGRLAAALTVGRSDDLEHARRWLTEDSDLSGAKDQLGDTSSDLAAI
jgi:3-phenylpropionate/trans-cinnamate dioxygenase ferredoxin reductase subunit